MVGEGGAAIDMSAPDALSAALAAWLSDASLRARLGDQARRHCLDQFSRDRVVDQILDYYRFVLADGRSRAAAPAMRDVAGVPS